MVINSLSLASINKVSPYKVKQVVDDGTFIKGENSERSLLGRREQWGAAGVGLAFHNRKCPSNQKYV